MSIRYLVKSAGFTLSLLVPALPYLGYQAGTAWLTPIVFFMLFPILGRVIGSDPTPGRDIASITIFERSYFTWLPRLYLPAWFASLIWTVLTIAEPGASLSVIIGLSLSAAIGSACASPIAHELMHRETPVDTLLARIMVSLIAYPHFIREHFSHHRYVGLPGDGLSALVGENLWNFLRRVLPAGLAAANALEAEILTKRRLGLIHSTIIQNRIFSVLFLSIFVWLGGLVGFLFFVFQAAYSIFAIQAINYVQHYGLVRFPGAPISHELSWEDNCPIANCVTFNINHHSNHHMQPSLPFYSLELDTLSPRLPASYMVMFFVASFPSVWRKIMDPRLIAYLKQRGVPIQQQDGDCLEVLGEIIR